MESLRRVEAESVNKINELIRREAVLLNDARNLEIQLLDATLSVARRQFLQRTLEEKWETMELIVNRLHREQNVLKDIKYDIQAYQRSLN